MHKSGFFFILIIALMLGGMTSCTSDQGLKQGNDTISSRQADDNDDLSEDEENDENEVEVDINLLPDVVTNALGLSYPGSEILEADQITHANGLITYDIEIKYQGTILEPMFDASGGFLGLDSDD